MSDSNTPDGAREEMLAALSRIQTHTITLETSLAASIKASGEYAAEIVTLKSERDAAQARVKQADIEHEETVKMMRELIAERDNEIACLMALKENGQ